MFKFLKDKLKKAIGKITKKVEDEVEDTIEEEVQDEVKEEKVEEVKEEKLEVKKRETKPKKKKKELIKEIKETVEEKKPEIKEPEIVEKIEEDIEKAEEVIHEKIEEVEEEIEKEEKEEKKGFFKKIFEKKEEKVEEEPKIEEKKGVFAKIKEKIVTKKISESKFNDLFGELEISLLENNVAFEVVEKIKEDLKKDLVDKPLKRGEIEHTILKSLKGSVNETLTFDVPDVVKLAKAKKDKPFVVALVGINGSGKTTTIAKLAHLFKENGLSVVLAAADSFRAAAIDQLKEWGNKLDVKVIAHDYGSDPAAISFDAIKHAKANNIDVVLIDTAGRQHSNVNLMQEMEKIIRVNKPDLKIFIGESLAGNDVVVQSQEFNKSVELDGVILTKADVDEKGGAMISVAYVTGKPILYLGMGQKPNDLEKFDKNKLLEKMDL